MRKPDSSLRVAVLAGGSSAERAVSLASGVCAAEALRRAGHSVQLVDPAKRDLESVDWHRFDGCFLALHGGSGEDGRMQERLERLGVVYTGSGPRASRLAMSKSAAKAALIEARIPTPDYVLLDSRRPADELVELVARLGFPLVVKPDAQGSSLGVGIARSAAELPKRVVDSGRFGSIVLAERLVEGREFTVAVFRGESLPPVEIVGREEVFDYRAKYSSTLIEYHFHAGRSPIIIEQLREMAARAAAAVGTNGLVRADLLLDADCRPWLLELNTLPGLTEHSLAPEAARHAGIDMPRLCDQILREALERG